VLAKAPDKLSEVHALFGIEPSCRLVQEQELRVRHDRLRAEVLALIAGCGGSIARNDPSKARRRATECPSAHRKTT
jgi:hypothetical protein